MLPFITIQTKRQNVFLEPHLTRSGLKVCLVVTALVPKQAGLANRLFTPELRQGQQAPLPHYRRYRGMAKLILTCDQFTRGASAWLCLLLSSPYLDPQWCSLKLTRSSTMLLSLCGFVIFLIFPSFANGGSFVYCLCSSSIKRWHCGFFFN